MASPDGIEKINKGSDLRVGTDSGSEAVSGRDRAKEIKPNIENLGDTRLTRNHTSRA